MLPSLLLLRSSNPAGFIFYCLVGVCIGVYIFFRGFRLLQRRQLILNIPLSKIRGASMGMVELSGLAAGPYTLVAPVSTRPCYCYRTFVWEWKQSGKNKTWVKVAAECMHVPFFLDDNTGKVMVDPRGADLDLHRDFQQEFCDSFFTTKEEVPPSVRSFLSRHGISTTNKIKVEEYCIKPKNALFLLGTLDENPGLEVTPQPIRDDEATSIVTGNMFSFSIDSMQLRQNVFAFATGGADNFAVNNFPASRHSSVSGATADKPSENRQPFASLSPAMPRIVQISSDSGPAKVEEMTQQQKIAAALLKAGITSPAAWAAAHVTPEGHAIDPNPGVAPEGYELRPPAVLMKGRNNPTFLISWRSQRDVAHSLAWKCALMVLGGPALALISLYLLLTLMHWF